MAPKLEVGNIKSHAERDLMMFSQPNKMQHFSSLFFTLSTFPRIRTDEQGGAWCPKNMIAKDGSEWLQIDLGSVHAITTSETQGRFGNGQGVEFSESYMLEYFRPRLGKWVRYRSREGEDVIKGNSNTYLAVKNELNPVILASKIRFHPYSHFKRTVCMRVEVYGCSWDGKNIILRDD